MQQVFNLMRANDLVWGFVVNNYLMGREPMAFDLLYWNADSTRMPYMMHSFYLRNMYQKNLLVQPGGITLKGVPIDLGQDRDPLLLPLDQGGPHRTLGLDLPRQPATSAGRCASCSGGSGHIAGVINPPSSTKYGYWYQRQATDASRRPGSPARSAHKGSWWPDWADWLAKKSGAKVPARVPGAGGLPALEPAPGSFVKVRAVD